MIGVRFGKLGDVVGDFAAMVRNEIRVAGAQELLQRRHGGAPIAGMPRRHRSHRVHLASRTETALSDVTSHRSAPKPARSGFGAAANKFFACPRALRPASGL